MPPTVPEDSLSDERRKTVAVAVSAVPAVKPVTRAVIDIGTNSVKMLVADVAPGVVTPLVEKSEQTRLGSGFYETHRLQPSAIEHTARSVAEFHELARQCHGIVPRIIATSAARDATNQTDLIAAITRATGRPVEVISGEQEAEWVFRGVTTDPALDAHRLLILDVGGGSTEFILGEKGHHSFRQSFPMGSVRLLEKLKPSDPPAPKDLKDCRAWLQDFFNREIAPGLQRLLEVEAHRHTRLVGTGGTTTILARIHGQLATFDRQRIEGCILTRKEIADATVHLWSQSLEDRRKIVGLPPKRADIIIMGAAIYEAAMEHFCFDELYTSVRGLRFGAIMD